MPLAGPQGGRKGGCGGKGPELLQPHPLRPTHRLQQLQPLQKGRFCLRGCKCEAAPEPRKQVPGPPGRGGGSGAVPNGAAELPSGQGPGLRGGGRGGLAPGSGGVPPGLVGRPPGWWGLSTLSGVRTTPTFHKHQNSPTVGQDKGLRSGQF